MISANVVEELYGARSPQRNRRWTRDRYVIFLTRDLRILCSNLLLEYSWTSLYMDGTASKIFLVICPYEAGTWDPNYNPGEVFLDYDFLHSKKVKIYLMRGQTLF